MPLTLGRSWMSCFQAHSMNLSHTSHPHSLGHSETCSRLCNTHSLAGWLSPGDKSFGKQLVALPLACSRAWLDDQYTHIGWDPNSPRLGRARPVQPYTGKCRNWSFHSWLGSWVVFAEGGKWPLRSEGLFGRIETNRAHTLQCIVVNKISTCMFFKLRSIAVPSFNLITYRYVNR